MYSTTMNHIKTRNYRAILTSIVLVMTAVTIMAQPIKSYKLDDMYATADEQFELGDYFNAAEWYRDIYNEVKSADVALQVGFSYYKLRDYVNAERWYSRVLEKDVDNIFVEDKFSYAKILRALGKDREAVQELETFLSLSDDDELRALAENELTGISQLSTFNANEELSVSFTSEEINSGNGEYNPVLYDDNTLYFSSFNRRKEIVLDGSENDYHAKIYRSTIGEDGYSKPEVLDRKVNRTDFHVSGITFSKDRRTMYYCRQQLLSDEVISSVIYYSSHDGQDWGPAEPVQGVNNGAIAMQPAMGEILGEDVMYFVSDAEGGLGGYDIYYAPVNGAGFGAPVNLGSTINTAEDDLSPHYYDGELYFSTSALPGMGNLDIYKSSWDGRTWSNPENLGNRFNSRFDDYSISYTADGTQGYLVSNRPDDKKKKLKSETCCYDIYSFSVRQLNIDLLVGVGEVLEGKEKQLKGATVDLEDLTIEEFDSQTLPDEFRFNFPLDVDRKYRVITSKEGYISDTTEVTTNGIIGDKQIRKKVILEKEPPVVLEPELPEYTLETVTINEAIRLNNIYYDYEKWDILPDAELDLNSILELMNEYGDMVIELSSHTDSRGTKPYNEDLSQKRAQSAKNWLTDKGVAEDRIKAVGYGESVILNRCVNGVRCTDDEHRFNRRTEFKILEGPQTIQIKRQINKDGSYNGSKQSILKFDKVPVISFKESNINIGQVVQGDKKTITFEFENTGDADLVIDLVTACKCTDISWPQEVIAPGETGTIIAVLDTHDMEGPYTKTIDIIANTNPIVVEAKFDVDVVLADN